MFAPLKNNFARFYQFKFLREAWQKQPTQKKTSNQIPPPPQKQIFPNIQTFTQANTMATTIYTYIHTHHIYKWQTSKINTNTHTSQMEQLKNYPLIAQIIILPNNDSHKKKGVRHSHPHEIHKTLSHHIHLQKEEEQQKKLNISNKLIKT